MPYVPDLDLVVTPSYPVARDQIAYAVERGRAGASTAAGGLGRGL